jgi:prevent-host-death family protein
MEKIGSREARTHLSRLLKRVMKGERITITRHGVAVAELVPVGRPSRSVAEAIAALQEFRKGNRLGGLTIKELIEHGRR